MTHQQLPDFTRRVFLNRTLQALGAAVCLPGAVGSLAGEPPVEGASDLKVLGPAELVTLEALGDALIPPGGAFEMGASDVGLARRIDSYLPVMAPEVVVGFRGALAFVEAKAPSLAGKAPPFSALSREDRSAVLNAMLSEGGLPRGVFVATKAVCVVHFYTADATWEFTGYDGPMLLQGEKS
jgi:hypothetical protein